MVKTRVEPSSTSVPEPEAEDKSSQDPWSQHPTAGIIMGFHLIKKGLRKIWTRLTSYLELQFYT